MDITIPIIAALPSINTIGSTHCLTMPIFTIWILTLLVALAISDINSAVKTPLIALIISLYWRNIDLLIGIGAQLYYPSLSTKYTSEMGRCILLRHFEVVQHNLSHKAPTIYICNYATDRFENALVLFIECKLTILVSEVFADRTCIDNIMSTIHVPLKNSYSFLKTQIVQQIAKGNSILCYSQKPLYLEGVNYGKIRTGVFSIAREIPSLTITPLYIEPIKTHIRSIYRQKIHIIAGEPRQVVNVAETINSVKLFFARMNTFFGEQ